MNIKIQMFRIKKGFSLCPVTRIFSLVVIARYKCIQFFFFIMLYDSTIRERINYAMGTPCTLALCVCPGFHKKKKKKTP